MRRLNATRLVLEQSGKPGCEVRESGIERATGTLLADSGACDCDGCSLGEAAPLALHARTLVVRWPGYSYWAGLSLPRGYASAETSVYRVEPSDGPAIKCVELVTYQTRVAR